jgi:8-oxo-dGTP pyrophosphatase MutT (NUDIX family)
MCAPGLLPPDGPEGSLNTGEPVRPRQAASVIVLRGGAQALELLLVQRTPQARFMGGMWVFPGGAVDRSEQDSEGDGPHRAAAVRELHEEAGIELPPEAELVPYSRWITPSSVSIRFDTRFFLTTLPVGQEPQVDGCECVDLGWFSPPAALEAHQRQRLQMVFPTIRHLQQLSEFTTVEELLEHARGRAIVPVEPRVVLDGGEVARIVLPGEPGYEQ